MSSRSISDLNRDLAKVGFQLVLEKAATGESEGRLVLQWEDQNPEHRKMSPLSVDFVSPQNLHRLKHGLSKNQPFAKALGLKSIQVGHGTRVLDATAGMGVDAFFMAAMGCEVRAIERNEVLAALLADGYRRFSSGATDGALLEIAARLRFEQGSSAALLHDLSVKTAESMRPHIVYLDPMFPDEGRSNSALPKKAMQMFRSLVGDDTDADQLLGLALGVATRRVVVKRPVHAPFLAQKKPTHSFVGKTARFDMYLVSAQPDQGS